MAKVLIVEDHAILAADVAAIVEGVGHEAVGPCRSLAEAERALRDDVFDVAIIDFDLGEGETTLEFSARLKRADIPFLVLTGCDREEMAAFFDRELLQSKPMCERLMFQWLNQSTICAPRA